MLISKALAYSNINHDKFILINNVLKEYDDIKKEIKYLITSSLYQRWSSIYKTMLSYCLRCRKNTSSKNQKVAKTKNGRKMLLSKCTVRDSRN